MIKLFVYVESSHREMIHISICMACKCSTNELTLRVIPLAVFTHNHCVLLLCLQNVRMNRTSALTRNVTPRHTAVMVIWIVGARSQDVMKQTVAHLI